MTKPNNDKKESRDDPSKHTPFTRAAGAPALDASASAPSQPTRRRHTEAGRSPPRARACTPPSARDCCAAGARWQGARRCTRRRARGSARRGWRGFQPCRVSAANAPHATVCAHVAAALEHAYPDHYVMGERELRRDEREAATRSPARSWVERPVDAPLLHRPDLVLWPAGASTDDALPVAVEVELTIKAPRRLLEICRLGRAAAASAGIALPRRTRGAGRTRASDRAGAGARTIAAVIPRAASRCGDRDRAALEEPSPKPVASGRGVNHPEWRPSDVLLLDQPRRSRRPPDP